ncbi:hypothetical protein BDV06DRAFT_222372 [Aspergillus oleicola]
MNQDGSQARGPIFGHGSDSYFQVNVENIFPPSIYGTMGPNQNAHAVPSQAYPSDFQAQSFQAVSSQTPAISQPAQNSTTGYFNSNSYLSPPSVGPAPMRMKSRDLSEASSSYSFTSNTEPAPSPHIIGARSPQNNQAFQGGIGQVAQPVMSPTSPSVRDDPEAPNKLARLIQILRLLLGFFIYPNCPFPSEAALRFVHGMLQEATLIVGEMLGPNQGHERPRGHDNRQYRCLLCQPNKQTMCSKKGTFRRHVTTKHHPDKYYYCPFDCDRNSSEGRFERKDKHRLHMTRHRQQPLDKEQLEMVTEPAPAPPRCTICNRTVGSWTEFIDCLCRHCLISDVGKDQDNGSDGGDSDGDDDNGDGGDDNGGNEYDPSSGNENFENPNGSGYGYFNGSQSGDPGAWGDPSFSQYFDAAPGMYPYPSSFQCQTVSPKSTATELDKIALELKSYPANRQISRQTKLDHLATWADGDTRISELFRTELCFRLGASNGSKQKMGEKQLSDKEAASVWFHVDVVREFQRLRFFEYRIFENQVQGSFLNCAHEPHVVHHLAIVSTAHDIIYRQVELRSEKPPEVPGDHIFYLAKEKDHASSEAALEATRRATKTRAHLRVRIRAIAGILALRASVSKAPLVVDNNEVGDGWELGIPVSSHPTQEEAVNILVWLVQILVFFLQMYPSPKVYVMLESGSLDLPMLV